MRPKLAPAMLALTAATALVSPAAAAVVIENYTFTANTGSFGLGTYSGSFSLGFDADTMVYTLEAIDFNNGSIDFDLSNTGLDYSNAPQLLIGGTISDVNGVMNLTDDFSLYFNLDFDNPQTYSVFAVSQSGVQSIGQDLPAHLGGTLVIARVNPAVPEPGTWAMMLLGFGAAGIAIRRRRTDALQLVG